jgi:hypothetical protein
MNSSRSAGRVGALLAGSWLAAAGCSSARVPGAIVPDAATPAASVAEPPPRGKPVEVATPADPDAGWREFHRPMTSLLASVEVETSSTYPNWPATRLTDGDPTTAWFSDRDDSAAKGKIPAITLRFEEPVTVRRVVVLGNRDASWKDGFAVLRGRVQVFGPTGATLRSIDQSAQGEKHDFEFVLEPPADHAQFVIFSSLSDEGAKNTYGDIGIAEIWAE